MFTSLHYAVPEMPIYPHGYLTGLKILGRLGEDLKMIMV